MLHVMHSALCEYRITEGNCFLIIIHHDNTDIIDATTVILYNTDWWRHLRIFFVHLIEPAIF